jgi:predicted solute-binding protein
MQEEEDEDEEEEEEEEDGMVLVGEKALRTGA